MKTVRKIPTRVTRSLKVLYTLVYNTLLHDNVTCGICVTIVEIKAKGKMSRLEYDRVTEDFNKRKPAGKQASEYWFNSKEERLIFLENIINSL